MKQVGLVVALVLASVNIGEAQTLESYEAASQLQAPRLVQTQTLDVDTQSALRTSQLSLRAPVTLMVAGAVSSVGLGFATAMSSLTHCLAEGCEDGSSRRTQVLFGATLASATLAVASLAWLITRSVKRRRARAALQALDVFGAGLRF